jgi:hypothetical protein
MDLFEYLKTAVGCHLISDLKFGTNKDNAIRILRKMNLSDVSKKQIADVENYLGIALA